jgi:hypothetical protein
LQCLGGVQIAILTEALGLEQLRAATESVRLQWPSARILILGYVPVSLDDHLYDESADPRFDPKKLLDMLKRLNQEAWARRSLAPEWHLNGRECEIWPPSDRRWRPEESDPKKDTRAADSVSHRSSSMRTLSPLHRRQ